MHFYQDKTLKFNVSSLENVKEGTYITGIQICKWQGKQRKVYLKV